MLLVLSLFCCASSAHLFDLCARKLMDGLMAVQIEEGDHGHADDRHDAREVGRRHPQERRWIHHGAALDEPHSSCAFVRGLGWQATVRLLIIDEVHLLHEERGAGTDRACLCVCVCVW